MTTPFPLVRETASKTRFTVDITTDSGLIDQAFHLRYKVFNLELGEGLAESHKTERDTDQYDPYCDHLVVIDETKQEVVGTYRIMPFRRAKENIGFYSETEFDLTNIYKHLPNSAEMGRCCVHAEYRSGLVMNLLWYGLARYMETTQTNYLFGCTSLNKGDTHQQASLIYKICEQVDALLPNHLWVKPQPGFEVKQFNPNITLPTSVGNPKRLLPSLLRGYLAVGVKFAAEPAYDPEFDVIDFFSIFDYRGINHAAKRFFTSGK